MMQPDQKPPAEQIKARAAELGFGPVGIASTEPFDQDLARTLVWLARGFNAGMGWLNESRARTACNPSELLPGAESLVVVAAPYAGPDPQPTDDVGPRGKVARYARGTDYHTVLKERLETLAVFVREVGGPETRTRCFVDSSPLPERAAAVRAGLGFIGKNTNLLTRQAGSWLLLGAILTTLRLPPDPPNTRDCGQCQLCLDACPTGALPEPYVLDANRCISYLTIEHKGSIAPELRAGMGDLIFGCDICQEVCPWNRAERSGAWPELGGPPEIAHPPLRDLLSMDPDEFRARYRHTPLARTKRRGLLRNAAIALGNVGTVDDLPTLIGALDDPEPLVRGHAAWAIGRIGEPAGREALESRRAIEQDAEVIGEIDRARGALQERAATTSPVVGD